MHKDILVLCTLNGTQHYNAICGHVVWLTNDVGQSSIQLPMQSWWSNFHLLILIQLTKTITKESITQQHPMIEKQVIWCIHWCKREMDSPALQTQSAICTVKYLELFTKWQDRFDIDSYFLSYPITCPWYSFAHKVISSSVGGSDYL